jgi:DNA-binding transcriptional MerR regulator
MQYKITDYNKEFKSVTTAEKFFSLENFQRRGPLVMADEFRNIQDETFRVNQDFHFILNDALEVGVPKRELIKLLRKRGMPYAKVKKLIDGKNIPYTGYDTRMKKRVNEAKKLAKERGETINKEYFYPKRLFRNILREYKNKKLKKEEEAPSRIEQLKKRLGDNKQSSIRPVVEEEIQTAEVKTPPLAKTPMPAKMATNIMQKDPITNLTRTETALLSPTEKVIAGRT